MFKKLSLLAYKINAAICGFFASIFGFVAKHPSLACLCAGFLFAQNIFAQATYDTGSKALGDVKTGLVKWIDPVQKVIYAIAGLVALVGAISVYIKMNNEEQDVKKSIMMIVGAVVFLIAAATALPLMLGVK